MTPFEIAQKYVYGEHNALTDKQEIIDMTKDIKQAISEQLILSGVVSTLPKKFSASAYTQAITGNYEEFVKWWDER